MTNPFDDTDGIFRVLVNHENQHSLWPDFAPIPDGWRVVYGPDGHDECLDYVEQNWRDMRPASLIRTMDESRSDDADPAGSGEATEEPENTDDPANTGRTIVDGAAQHG